MSDRLLTALASYSDEVMPYLITQYKNSPRIQAIIESMNSLAMNAERAVFEIRDLIWLSTASGNQLDMLGSIYGVARNGRTDAAYRQAIKFRSYSGFSGTPEEIIQFLTVGLGASFVEFVPEWIEDAVPAQYVIRTDIGVDYDTLQDLSPAGVRGLQGFFLLDGRGHPIIWGAEDPSLSQRIMHVGVGNVSFPEDRVWDGGVGEINPSAFQIKEKWPFRETTGIGEFPDGGVGQIDLGKYTFLDGTFADAQGA